MEDEQDRLRKENERKRKEGNLVNPFPTGSGDVVLRLPEDLFAEAAGTYVVDPTSNPDDTIELKDVAGGGEECSVQPAEQQRDAASDDDYVGALVPYVSPVKNKSQPQPQPSAAQMARTLGAFRARTPFAAALQSGTLNEKNPTRDYTWAAIFAVASLGCVIGGATHGNFLLMGAGLFLGAVALYLNYRASKSDPNKSNASSLSIGLGLSQPTFL